MGPGSLSIQTGFPPMGKLGLYRESIVQHFMHLANAEKGVIAVHCLAGLGRTGTLIALWIMQRYCCSEIHTCIICTYQV